MSLRLSRATGNWRIIAALVTVLGIGVSFLVMRWPTFTTLRVAGKALSSAGEATWWGAFREPTRAQIKKAMKRDPSDWKLRLLYAKRLFRGASWEERSGEGKADPSRMREFEELVANNPRVVAARAAYAEWLVTRYWDFLHPIDAEERARFADGAG
jgi:hypothetical protein